LSAQHHKTEGEVFKMPKVLYIGFGISPFMKGGAIGYQESQMEAITNRGWEAVCFYAAPRYTGFSNQPFIKTWHRNRIKFVELYNAPERPGYQINPDRQCSNPIIERLTKRVVDEEKPDLVHIHELQMHPASIIDIIFERGIPSIKTMHNYYDICPQRDLMYQGRELCINFENGKRCASCLIKQSFQDLSINQRVIRRLRPVLPKFLLVLYHEINKIISYKNTRDNIKESTGQDIRVYSPSQIAVFQPSQYYQRRRFFIERLNKFDVIHCSTSRSAEIFNNYGVIKEKLKVISHSAKSIELIVPKPLRNNEYPIVFGYLGGKWLHKGYQILIDAFAMLNQKKAKLIIWDPGESGKPSPNLNIELRKSYGSMPLTQMLQEIDVGLVPSIWEEMLGFVGPEFLTARIPVIGSKIGGIPDWLKDGENGFLVPPGDVQQLAQKMDLFINNPSLIAQMQRQIKPWKTLEEHTTEMINFYEEVIARQKQS